MIIVGGEAARSVRNQAEAIAIGLEAGALVVADAVEWADAVIDAEAVPPPAVCEVATMGGAPLRDVIDMLRRIPGPSDRAVAEVLLVWRLARLIRKAPSRARVAADALYQFSLSGIVKDQKLRAAIRAYADCKFHPVDNHDRQANVALALSDLSEALGEFVERSSSLLDPPDGAPLPWLASDI